MHGETRHRRQWVYVLMWVCVFILSAAPTGAAKEKLTWLADITGGQERIAFYEAVAERFNRSHSDIEVAIEPVVNFADYYNVLQVRMAGGVPPDLVFSNSPSIQTQGLYMDLTSFIEKDKTFKLSDYLDVAVDFGRIPGRPGLFTLPNHLATHGLYYNTEMFLNAGLGSPNQMVARNEWSWDDFVKVGKKVIQRLPDGTLQRGFVSALDFQMFISTFNARIIDVVDGEERSAVNSPELLSALQTWERLYYQEKIVQGGGRNAFLAGSVAMNTHWNDLWPLYMNAPFEVDAVRYPWATTRNIMVNGGGWSIPVGVRNPSAAWELMKFVIGDYAQQFYGEVVGGIPCKKSIAIKVWTDKSWGVSNKEQAFLTPVLENGVRQDRAVAPSWDAVFNAINPIVRNIQSGRIGPREAQAQMDQLVTGNLMK